VKFLAFFFHRLLNPFMFLLIASHHALHQLLPLLHKLIGIQHITIQIARIRHHTVHHLIHFCHG